MKVLKPDIGVDSVRRVVFALLLGASLSWSAEVKATDLVINEVDYDQDGADIAEFIELKNVSGASITLSDYRISLINGDGSGGAEEYDLVTLPEFSLAPGHYFVICRDSANVLNCDLEGLNYGIQNANDAVALVTSASPATVIDTVSYEGDVEAPYTEGSGIDLEDPGNTVEQRSISRWPDGVDSDQNNVDFHTKCSTPGKSNEALCHPQINEVSPEQNSHGPNPVSQIRVSFQGALDEPTVDDTTFVVHRDFLGAASGAYTFSSAVFTPDTPFFPGERVQTTLSSGVTVDGDAIEPCTYVFTNAVQAGSGIFFDSGQVFPDTPTYGVAIGDLDGDGDLDAVEISRNQGSHVRLNQGGAQGGTPGELGPPVQTLGTDDSLDVTLGDVDGDGDLDVMVANILQPNRIWINVGVASGTFSDSAQTLGNSASVSVALGDIDGDGDMDAFVANDGEPDKVWINTGAASGVFADSGQLLGNSSTKAVALGDLDGDGDLDAYAANEYQSDTVWVNQGGAQGGAEGVFVDSGQTLSSHDNSGVALGDVDGDGDLDAFVVADAASDPDQLWINQGGLQGGTHGSFLESGQVIATNQSTSVALGDLDGDSDLDAFVTNTNQPNQVLFNQGGDQGGTIGVFADSEQPQDALPSQAVALGDLDGDSDLDAFVGNSLGGANRVMLNADLDFGDATTIGQTLKADDGARHPLDGSTFLGSLADPETDALHNTSATADDLDNSDDEDGVLFPNLYRGHQATLTISASANGGVVTGWIDADSSGTFEHPAELLTLQDEVLSAGNNSVTVDIPDIPYGTYLTRFRYSTQIGLGPDGLALDGEVEDHRVTIENPPIEVNSTSGGGDIDPGDDSCSTGTILPGGDPECTLRAAISQTNFTSGPDVIQLPVGTYGLHVAHAGGDNDDNSDGDFDVADELTITADGSGAVVIDGEGLDRVLHVLPGASLQLENLSIVNGMATAANGGAVANDGDLRLESVLLSGNRADAAGGGIYLGGAGYAELVNLTMTGNRADHGGGCAVDTSGTVTIDNSILFGNRDTTGTGTLASAVVNLSGTATTCSHSIIQGSGGSAAWIPADLTDGGNNLDYDPLFRTPVVPSAAPTTEGDAHLASGSPAVDAGDNAVLTVFTDLDGEDRIQNGTVEMGPYEGHEPYADLRITKTDGISAATPGEGLIYTIVASNAGPSTDPAAFLSDVFPASLTCTFTSVAAGGATGNTAGAGNLSETLSMPRGSSVTYTVDCAIDSDATGTLSNTATIASSVTDDDPANNSATDNDTVLMPEADLAISMSDSPDPVLAGNQLTYSVRVDNAGPSEARNVVVTGTLPVGVALAATSGCAEDPSGVPTCTLGSIGAGSFASYSITVDVDPAARGLINSLVTVSTSATDPVSGNDSASEDTTVNAEIDLALTKTDAADPLPGGDPLVYTLEVTNDGPSEATGVVVTDTLPAGVTLGSTSGCTEDPVGAPTCTLGTIGAGATVRYTLTATVDPSPPASIINSASVSATETDTDPSNNSADEETALDDVPPEVTLLNSVNDTGNGVVDECESALVSITEFIVTFSEPMLNPSGNSDPNDVTNPASYLLVATGADGDFSTSTCGAVFSDDLALEIDSVLYDSDSLEARLLINALPAAQIRVMACGTALQDLAGNPLDGDGDGSGGDDFIVTFRSDPGNRFENGHFDCPSTNLDGWTVSDPVEITRGDDDLDGSQSSGSVQIMQLAANSDFEISQCAPVSATGSGDLSAWLRLSTAGYVSFSAGCEFFATPGCGSPGSGIDSSVGVELLSDSGGVWLPFTLIPEVPAGAMSARCSFAFATESAADFTAWLDDLVLRAEGLIFRDGFETGDTTQWNGSTL